MSAMKHIIIVSPLDVNLLRQMKGETLRLGAGDGNDAVLREGPDERRHGCEAQPYGFAHPSEYATSTLPSRLIVIAPETCFSVPSSSTRTFDEQTTGQG